MASVKVNFNTSETRDFQASLRKMAIVSDKLPSELVNQKGWRVFQKATWWMNQVSPGTIAGELGAGNTLTLVKSGKRKGQFRSSKKATFFGEGDSRIPGVPLLALIIQKRGNSPFKGKTKEEGSAAMLEKMKQVYGARQKSRAYFKTCFATIRDIFRSSKGSLPFSDPNSRGSGTVASLSRDKGRIADANPAKKGIGKAIATFWLVSPKHDLKDAMDKYASPVLQRAYDEEAEDTWKHAAEQEYKQAISAFGIKVS